MIQYQCRQCLTLHPYAAPTFCRCGGTAFTLDAGAGGVSTSGDESEAGAGGELEDDDDDDDGATLAELATPEELAEIDRRADLSFERGVSDQLPGELAPEIHALHAQGLCSQNDCGQRARARFTWPGRPELLACPEHAERARHVATAMGFELEIREL
jgi:hypothetical protein